MRKRAQRVELAHQFLAFLTRQLQTERSDGLHHLRPCRLALLGHLLITQPTSTSLFDGVVSRNRTLGDVHCLSRATPVLI